MTLTYEIRKKHGWRITGWHHDNPVEIENAFRKGFLWGACRAVKLPIYKIELVYERMMDKRGDLYWIRKWDEVEAALLRGKSHGLWYVFYHLYKGGSRQSCRAWIKQVERWAAENPPQMDALSAMPPKVRCRTASSNGDSSHE